MFTFRDAEGSFGISRLSSIQAVLSRILARGVVLTKGHGVFVAIRFVLAKEGAISAGSRVRSNIPLEAFVLLLRREVVVLNSAEVMCKIPL